MVCNRDAAEGVAAEGVACRALQQRTSVHAEEGAAISGPCPLTGIHSPHPTHPHPPPLTPTRSPQGTSRPTSSGSEGEGSEKKRRFAALRKNHYNMKTALLVRGTPLPSAPPPPG